MMTGPGMLHAIVVGLVAAACASWPARAQQALALEAKIPLGDVSGRIDHMAIDLRRRHLFVAELGNDTVGVVDVGERKVVHRIGGLKEPQGVGYVASTDMLFVANGDDGTVRVFSAADFSPRATIALGSDADNVRMDEAANEVVVGHGRGALAVLDPQRLVKIADIPLKAHPEGFRIDSGAHRIYVNVPNAREVAVIDSVARRQVAAWPLPDAASNFPMALDETGGRVVVVTRSPPKVIVLSPETGGAFATIDTCGDADDVFVQPKRQRLYVSCGSGAVDVIELSEGAYYGLARVPTVSGARTALYVPELDRLFVAVRARGSEPAAIWVFRPIS